MADKILDNLGPIVLGLTLLIVAIVDFVRYKRYVPVEAKCIHVAEQWFYTMDAVSKGRAGRYKFSYNGKEYIPWDKSFISSKKLKTGEIYTLYVDPTNPEKFVTQFTLRYAAIFAAAGVLFTFIAPLVF